MGFMSDDLTPKRPATAVTPITDFPSNDDGQSAPSEPVTSPEQTQTPPSGDTSAAQATSTTDTAPIDTNGLVAGNQPSFTQQPTEDVTKVTPNQGISIDWSKPYADIEQNPLLQQMKPYDIMRDFEKNGNGDWASFMPWLQSLGDVDKTVAANAVLQKKAERQAKWEQLGNLFQHIGNFFRGHQGIVIIKHNGKSSFDGLLYCCRMSNHTRYRERATTCVVALNWRHNAIM